jgi:hypothetical protein
MLSRRRLNSIKPCLVTALAALAPVLTGCSGAGEGSDNITDVQHTPVERQAIGNCWLYAQSSWVESMHLRATGEEYDVSQSYWTYWHWFGEIRQGWGDEISTGGNQWTADEIALERGVMTESAFVPEDATGEMSDRQSTALATINEELKTGRLADSSARQNGQLVREVLDEAWGLSAETRSLLNDVFGADGSNTLQANPSAADGTAITAATDFAVSYPTKSGDQVEITEATLDVAIDQWSDESYPGWASDSERRAFEIRVQRALHERAPVVVTWNVDFNALENDPGDMQGSFNLDTLADAGGPGRQGGHMTVFEDYQADTQEYGVLAAGVTLDPNNEEDAAKLAAALEESSTVMFWRVKNSWGSLRPDREFAPGFPGYHDLYRDYMKGPIRWCPDIEGEKTEENCSGETVPFRTVHLPPGF